MADETFVRDNLIAGDFPKVIRNAILTSGEVGLRGHLLGRITASGKFLISLSGAGDGSEVPVAVLTEDTDATAGDLQTAMYFSGEFNEDRIVFGAAHDKDTVRAGLDGRSIFLRKPHTADIA